MSACIPNLHHTLFFLQALFSSSSATMSSVFTGVSVFAVSNTTPAYSGAGRRQQPDFQLHPLVFSFPNGRRVCHSRMASAVRAFQSRESSWRLSSKHAQSAATLPTWDQLTCATLPTWDQLRPRLYCPPGIINHTWKSHVKATEAAFWCYCCCCYHSEEARVETRASYMAGKHDAEPHLSLNLANVHL